MKIALIIHKLNIRGGVQRHVLSIAREFKKNGHSVKIYTFNYDKSSLFAGEADGLEIVSLRNYKPLRSVKDVFRENSAARELSQKIDKDTDILNPHDQVCYKVSFYFKKNVKNIPSVWTMHDMPTKLWFWWRESQFRPELKLTFLKLLAYRFIDYFNVVKFVKAQDGILVLDSRDKYWVKEFFGMDSEVIGNGLDIEKFPFTERKAPEERHIKILMHGIFAVHRRFEDGILALKILRAKGYDAYMDIIGDFNSDKNYYKMILSLIREEKLENFVNLRGAVSETDLLTAYKECDIFLFPNHLQSWGLAVFEAMASGMPVIVSKTAGASEVLVNGENALLIEALSPQDIALKIEKLIKDSELYLNISRNGRAFVEKNISWSKLTDKYESRIKILISSYNNIN